MSKLYLDSGAINVLLHPKHPRRTYASGKPVHTMSKELENTSVYRPLRPLTVVSFRRRKVNEILGDIFPSERSVIQTIYNRTNSHNVRSLARSEALKVIFDDDETCILEQKLLAESLNFTTETLLRYDLALSNAREHAKGVGLRFIHTLAKLAASRTNPLAITEIELLCSSRFDFNPQQTKQVSTLIVQTFHGWYSWDKLTECLISVITFQHLNQIAFGFQDLMGVMAERSTTVGSSASPICLANRALRNPKVRVYSPLHLHLNKVKTGYIARRTPRCIKVNQTNPSMRRLNYELATSKLHKSQIDESVEENREWLIEHCRPNELAVSTPFERKKFAVDLLVRVLHVVIQRRQFDNFHRLADQVSRIKCVATSTLFLKHKSASLLLTFARRFHGRRISACWKTFVEHVQTQRALEQTAAAIVIQTGQLRHSATKYVEILRRERASRNIQYCWKCFYARKMAVRERRFHLYSRSCRKVQRQYRVHLMRLRFQQVLHRNQSVRMIQRGFRSYMARQFLAKMRKLKHLREYSVLTLQCWIRQVQAYRIKEALRHERRTKAAKCIQKRWFHFKLCKLLFDRAEERDRRRNEAATMLQLAYRSRQARRRMRQLQDNVDRMRREEILRQMWERASAETIQTWWRRIH